MIHRKLVFAVIIALAICLPVVEAAAQSWSSFAPATFTGIHISPAFGSLTTSYTLSLDPDPNPPTITIGASTYDVNWISTVYVVADPQSAAFIATEGANDQGWTWDDQHSGVRGYKGQGNPDRLFAGESMTFSFALFQITSGSVLAGFHVGYQDGDTQKTSHYKENTVPEPSALTVLAAPITALAFRRRRRA